jgi:hypothetical protein
MKSVFTFGRVKSRVVEMANVILKSQHDLACQGDAQDSIEVGFGDSMRELHGNVMQAVNVIHT